MQFVNDRLHSEGWRNFNILNSNQNVTKYLSYSLKVATLALEIE